MNETNSGQSSGGQGSGGVPPIDPRRAYAPPPPPPPGAVGYGYGGYPPPQRRGPFAWGIKFFMGLAFVTGLLIFGVVIGFYAGLFTAVQQAAGKVAAEVYRSGNASQRIAIIPIEGLIDEEMAWFVRDAVETAINDDSIHAAVVWVNSGGGLVGPSDQILNQLNRLREEAPIPLVASYGSLAASGGYYVSCQSDYIFAEPTCLTGSIGVIAQVMTVEDLLVDKLGINPVIITATDSPQKSIANTILRDWTEQDREEVQRILDAMHDSFVKAVEQGRVAAGQAEAKQPVMTEEQLAEVKQGRVFLTEEALVSGLIDDVGYLDDAIAFAKESSGITVADPQVVIYRRPLGFLGALAGAHREAPRSEFELDGRKLRQVMTEFSMPQFMYLYQP